MDLGGRGEDIAYPKTFIEYLLRTPPKKGVGTGGSKQKLTALLSRIRQFSTCVAQKAYLFTNSVWLLQFIAHRAPNTVGNGSWVAFAFSERQTQLAFEQ